MHLISQLITWVGRFVPQLALRLVVAWQAWDFGTIIYYNKIEYSPIQQIFPLSLLSNNISFGFLVWWSIIGAIFLILGFRVRFVTLGLLFISIESLILHAPDYINIPIDIVSWVNLWHSTNIADLLFKSELLIAFISLILLFSGAGLLSIDCIINWEYCRIYARKSKNKTKNLQKQHNAIVKNINQHSTIAKEQYTVTEKIIKEKPKINTKQNKTTKKIIIEKPPQITERIIKECQAKNNSKKRTSLIDTNVPVDKQLPQYLIKKQTVRSSNNRFEKKHHIKIKPDIDAMHDVDNVANMPIVN